MAKLKKRPPGRPSAQEAEDIRQHILSAATREFIARGYASANLNRIATQAGSTKPTIYRLFSSKEELFRTIIRHALDEATAQINDFSEDERPPELVLKMVADFMMKSYASGVLPGLWRTALAARTEFPELYEQTLDHWRQKTIAGKLSLYFAKMESGGKLRVKHPQLAAHNFALLVGPASDVLNLANEQFTQEERIEEVIRLFLKGYTPSGD